MLRITFDEDRFRPLYNLEKKNLSLIIFIMWENRIIFIMKVYFDIFRHFQEGLWKEMPRLLQLPPKILRYI